MAMKRAKAPSRATQVKRPSQAPRVTAAKKAAFLAAFAQLGTVTHAAKAAGVDRSAPYRWASTDDEFREAWDEAQAQATDALEREARRRAIEGVEEPVIHQGMMTMLEDPKTGEIRPLTVRKYSDTLLIFLMKGANPAKYRDNSRVEVSGPGGGPIKSESKAEADIAIQPDQVADVLSVLAAAGVVGGGSDDEGEE